jgi:hypothetical protein
MRWTRVALKTRALSCGRRSRVVLTPRRWRQVGESNFHRRRWQESPVTEESAEKTVKTIVRGMPDVSGVTVVTNACAYYHCARGCGRAERPAFPAPSDRGGREFQARLARIARRDRGCARNRSDAELERRHGCACSQIRSRILAYSAAKTAFAISAVPLLPPNSIGLMPSA